MLYLFSEERSVIMRGKQFCSSIAGGFMVGVGATAFLSCSNKYVGGLLFTVGLMTIVVFRLSLFTGNVGYIVTNKPSYLIDLAVTWLGNLVGTTLVAIALRNTRALDSTLSSVYELVDTKLSDNPLSSFILAIFCGLLMFIAVYTYKTHKEFTGVIVLMLCVTVFAVCGFEHCVANMYFFGLAGAWSLRAAVYLVIMSLGNAFGAVLLPLCIKFMERK